MTTYFDELKERPKASPQLGNLSAEERMMTRRIRVRGVSRQTKDVSVGTFTGVVYLFGDEKQAAEVFVETNREKLEQLNYSRKNLISTSVDRELYDWILHYLGERDLEKYDSVVIERRPNEAEPLTWCISRRAFEENPMRRYNDASSGAGRVTGCTLEELYDEFDQIITAGDLAAHPAVSGDVREVLDAFRQADRFDCTPVTVDGDLAVEKSTTA